MSAVYEIFRSQFLLRLERGDAHQFIKYELPGIIPAGFTLVQVYSEFLEYVVEELIICEDKIIAQKKWFDPELKDVIDLIYDGGPMISDVEAEIQRFENQIKLLDRWEKYFTTKLKNKRNLRKEFESKLQEIEWELNGWELPTQNEEGVEKIVELVRPIWKGNTSLLNHLYYSLASEGYIKTSKNSISYWKWLFRLEIAVDKRDFVEWGKSKAEFAYLMFVLVESGNLLLPSENKYDWVKLLGIEATNMVEAYSSAKNGTKPNNFKKDSIDRVFTLLSKSGIE